MENFNPRLRCRDVEGGRGLEPDRLRSQGGQRLEEEAISAPYLQDGLAAYTDQPVQVPGEGLLMAAGLGRGGFGRVVAFVVERVRVISMGGVPNMATGWAEGDCQPAFARPDRRLPREEQPPTGDGGVLDRQQEFPLGRTAHRTR